MNSHTFINIMLGRLSVRREEFKLPEPFKTQYQHTNSPNWSPYISLKNELREFDKRSKHW